MKKTKHHSAMKTYFRKHPLQKVLLSLLATIIICSTIGIIGYPHYREYMAIRKLGDADPAKRKDAMERAYALAKESPRMVTRLQDAMASADDRKFKDIAIILQQVNRFHDINGRLLNEDRLRAINFAAVRDDKESRTMKYSSVCDTIMSPTDNQYVRQILSLASTDKDPEVRIPAAVLAGRVGDDKILGVMLDDPDPDVAASAAMDAALAGMKHLGDKIAQVMDKTSDPELLPCCAYALATLDGAKYSSAIIQKLDQTFTLDAKKAEDRANQTTINRLLYVTTILNDDPSRATVTQILEKYRKAKIFPCAMAIFAAGRLNIPAASDDILGILREAAKRRGTLREIQLLAALDATEKMNLPALKELYEVSYALLDIYNPNLTLSTCVAVRLLGQQAVSPQAGKNGCPTLEKCVELLRIGSQLELVAKTPKDQTWTASCQTITMPELWAASAVAMWMIAPGSEYLKEPYADDDGNSPRLIEPDFNSPAYAVYRAITNSAEAVDYVAWHIGRSGKPQAAELARRLLPPRDIPKFMKENNGQIRAAGAMTLAMATQDTPDQQQSRTLVESYEKRMSYSRDFYEYRTYTCASLILGGNGDRQQVVESLLTMDDFPKKRSVATLALIGDLSPLKWLLWEGQIPFERLCKMLANEGIGEIIAAAWPKLPKVDCCVEYDVQLWQARILQDYYGIHHTAMETILP